MKTWLSLHRLAVSITVGVLFAILFVLFSQTFQDCMKTNEVAVTNQSQNGSFTHFLRLTYWCSGVFVKEAGEGITAVATVVMAIFTGTLWWASTEQGRLTRDSVKLATTAADAAIAAERARFHVIIDKHNIRDFITMAEMYDNSPGMAVSRDIAIAYHFKNYGKCPGLITSISHGMRLSETAPDDVVYTVVRQVPKEYMVPSLGETERQTCERARGIASMQDAIAIRTGRTLVWFFGRFDYVDFVTNRPQVHRFLLRYIQTESGEWRFQSFNHNHYNEST